MRLRFAIHNPTDAHKILDGGEVIPAGGIGAKSYDSDEVEYLLPELEKKGLEPFILVPCTNGIVRPKRRGLRNKRPAADLPASTKQQVLYTKLTGKSLSPNATRVEASDLIDAAFEARGDDPWSFRGGKNLSATPKAATPPALSSPALGPTAIIPNRLFLAAAPNTPANLDSYTLLVNWSAVSLGKRQGFGLLECEWTEQVDGMFLAGIVRMTAAVVRGANQRVLIYADEPCAEMIAACVLREFLGCSAEVALGILRRHIPGALVGNSDLLQTLEDYRLS